MPAPRPFPWAAHERVRREDAEAVRAFQRWMRSRVRADVAPHVLASLLDTPVRVSTTAIVNREVPPGGSSDTIAVSVAPSGAEDWKHAALLLVEPALAAAFAARVLRRSAPKVVGLHSGGEGIGGAFAAIVAAVARRASGGRAVKILEVGSARELEAKLAAGGAPLIEASFTVLLDDEAFSARVLVPRAEALDAPEPAWTRASLAALGDLPLAVSVVADVSRSTAGEIGSLRCGDAWLPGAWPLRATAAGALEGRVLLASPSDEIGVWGEVSEGSQLSIGEGYGALAWTPASSEGSARGPRETEAADRKEEGVSESERDALVEAVGEVPVVVRVELGVVEMRAKEWASLAPGDVVTLGRKIGEAVTLRVGGVAVARGELVDLDGEIAVRILGRTNTEAPAIQARPATQER